MNTERSVNSSNISIENGLSNNTRFCGAEADEGCCDTVKNGELALFQNSVSLFSEVKVSFHEM